jgi:hypothetical protein
MAHDGVAALTLGAASAVLSQTGPGGLHPGAPDRCVYHRCGIAKLLVTIVFVD